MAKPAICEGSAHGGTCPVTKILFVKKLTIILLTAGFLAISATGLSQNVRFSGTKVSLETVFSAVEKQTGYVFVYDNSVLSLSKPVTVTAQDKPLEKFLSELFKAQPALQFKIDGKSILVSPKAKTPSGKSQASSVAVEDTLFLPSVRGLVLDQSGHPVSGANVEIEGTKKGTFAGNDGTFTVHANGGAILSISSVGFTRTQIRIVSNTMATVLGSGYMIVANQAGQLIIMLEKSVVQLDQVEVSTGMFSRKKETFTGVTSVYSGKEIRTASRENVLEALNMLDPSFKIIRNNNLGSDPNQLPQIEIRGSRSINGPVPSRYSQQLKLQYESDPNRPLFILDGFETDLTTIMNLDINRVASITLLKDAASTALYGSRSANGVVVVETIRPAAGKLQVAYTATGTLVVPDLNGYNMMNAAELLKFQELASAGPDAPGPFAIDAQGLNRAIPALKHTFRENSVLNGVNSNWLKAPLQAAASVRHSLMVTGGDGYFTYNAGFSRGTTNGVMKGSANTATAGFINLSYRKGDINIANNLTINGKQNNAGPYGSFTDYVKVPPYYAINNQSRYLEQEYASYYTAPTPVYPTSVLSTNSFQFSNPLYNASLPYKNSITGLAFTNNLMANWDVLRFLRLSAAFQYSKSQEEADFFISPLNTQFDQVDNSLKGRYDYSSQGVKSYQGNFTVTYRDIFAGKHILNMNLRSDISSAETDGKSISAVGFAATSEPLLYLAGTYLPGSKPSGTTTIQHSMDLIGSLNYSYDMRYNLDLSYNFSGTSNFGIDRPYQSFYAVGVGWNLNREKFLKNKKWLNQLKVSANYGLTGNLNAGNFGSSSTYFRNNTPTFFGESVQLKSVGNPDLAWTKTYTLSYNLSARVFNKISMTISGYRNLTDPLIVALPLPPSAGLPEGIPVNVGRLTTNGLELTLDANLVSTKNWSVNVGLNAPFYYKSRYSGLGNVLDKYNDSARNNGYTQRYRDGSSPDDVWAVRSMGIGQVRGMEVFLTKDGKYTYLYDKNNEVVIGSSRPVSQGNINIMVRYRRLTLSTYSHYVIQEMKFNTALYNKVENISKDQMEYNQDKRALYVRWQKPGDDASFLGVTQTSMGISSRFLQKETSLTVQNINFNYDVLDQSSQGVAGHVRKKLGLQSLSLGINTTNLVQFQLSNIKLERGLDYPFQRSVMVNLNVIF